MAVFPVMLADPYIISDVPRASPRIYCLYCGFTSVRVSQHKHEEAMQLLKILLLLLLYRSFNGKIFRLISDLV